MSKMIVCLLIIACTLASICAFSPSRFAAKAIASSSTKVYEDFRLDKNTIVSDERIFTEKQLREFTATYYDDIRSSPFDAIFGLFKKDDDNSQSKPKAAAAGSKSSVVTSSLKPTVSLSVLEEKTTQYVQGKIDEKVYFGVLKAAFGNNLSKVLPEILSNLPAGKSASLKKIAK